MRSNISNNDDVIDSRDVIERVEELESEIADAMDGNKQELQSELIILQKLAAEGECSPDWQHGESLIHDNYFTDYIKELINDCYPMPKEFDSGNWPWCHMTFDYEAAAEEAKADYQNVEFDGVTYWIRSC